MTDDSNHDDECPHSEALRNPVVQKAIEDTYVAFFNAIGGHPLKYHEIILSIAHVAARIAETVYANIEASDADQETINEHEFHDDILLEFSGCLEGLLSIEANADDDEEVNEPFPRDVTTH